MAEKIDSAAVKGAHGDVRLRRPERAQFMMQMACRDELLPKEHQARVIWSVVQQLDLSGFHEAIKAREGVCGRDTTDPALLISLTSASAQSSRGFTARHAGWGRRVNWTGCASRATRTSGSADFGELSRTAG